jgi:hypothetical protein
MTWNLSVEALTIGTELSQVTARAVDVLSASKNWPEILYGLS